MIASKFTFEKRRVDRDTASSAITADLSLIRQVGILLILFIIVQLWLSVRVAGAIMSNSCFSSGTDSAVSQMSSLYDSYFLDLKTS